DPKHIEVQILGDKHQNIVHLGERDCSIQRRHQKVVEVAPSLSISENVKERMYESAVSLAENIGYVNAGTVEFLVKDEAFYFIEDNPCGKVEDKNTEMSTCGEIGQTQIKITESQNMPDEKVDRPQKKEIVPGAYAIQSRVTTEYPLNDFMPDTGRI